MKYRFLYVALWKPLYSGCRLFFPVCLRPSSHIWCCSDRRGPCPVRACPDASASRPHVVGGAPAGLRPSLWIQYGPCPGWGGPATTPGTGYRASLHVLTSICDPCAAGGETHTSGWSTLGPTRRAARCITGVGRTGEGG